MKDEGTKGRGRPVGWRKRDARRRSIMIRLEDLEYQKLKKLAEERHLTMSDVVRAALWIVIG
jgi:predicted DNA-binding ribbon-helix-helix protein